jgi:hypothetical protein
MTGRKPWYVRYPRLSRAQAKLYGALDAPRRRAAERWGGWIASDPYDHDITNFTLHEIDSDRPPPHRVRPAPFFTQSAAIRFTKKFPPNGGWVVHRRPC